MPTEMKQMARTLWGFLDIKWNSGQRKKNSLKCPDRPTQPRRYPDNKWSGYEECRSQLRRHIVRNVLPPSSRQMIIVEKESIIANSAARNSHNRPLNDQLSCRREQKRHQQRQNTTSISGEPQIENRIKKSYCALILRRLPLVDISTSWQ